MPLLPMFNEDDFHSKRKKIVGEIMKKERHHVAWVPFLLFHNSKVLGLV
jgi:hypothetical protein